MARSHAPDSLRPIEIRLRFLERQPASVLYSSGLTRVLCVATLEPGVPPFLEGSGQGWATAEYNVLPGATLPRHARERAGRLDGRTQEIQRLIGRALRAVLELEALDGWTLRLDCDVLQADGGTRTAAINGAYLAACLAADEAVAAGKLRRSPVRCGLAAVSAGKVGGELLLDLDYEEDARAAVDLNVVKTDSGLFVELQGAAEHAAFSRKELDALLDLAGKGLEEILEVERRTLAAARGGR